MDVRFAYPDHLADALTAAAAGHRPVAGGTDLVVGTRQGKWSLPDNLVALDRIAELRGISGRRMASASARRRATPTSRLIRTSANAGRPSPTRPRSSARRRRGTSGRSAATSRTRRLPPRRAGRCSVSKPRWSSARPQATAGSRWPTCSAVPAGRPSRPDELIVAVELPELDGAGSCYVRLEFRRQMEIAVVGATAVVRLDGGVVRDARIAITALAPTVRRVAAAESALVGTDGGPAAAAEAGRLAAEAATPISDVRASLDYRRAMAAVVVRRAVTGRSPARVARRSRSPPAPASSERGDREISGHAPGERDELPSRDRRRPDPAVRPPRRARV